MNPLATMLSELAPRRILVVGDLILDRYIEGDAGRVSPEAPVLVFETRSQRHLLGGACNVAANLVALGAETAILGVIGEDAAGVQLGDMLRAEGIRTDGLIVDPSRPTTRKTRYVNKTAQILRVDEERRHAVSGAAEAAIRAHLAARPLPYDAIVLSDYGKGMLPIGVIQAAIEAARSQHAIVVVDPKGIDYSIYRGVDLLTPNREEAEAATGVRIRSVELGDLRRTAQRLREIAGIQDVTITLGKDGIYHEAPDGTPTLLPTKARAVFDVTGAGDTVVAMLALTRSAGLPLPDCLALANVAAGIVVGHFGTWAVSRSEVLAALGERGPGKVLSRDEAIAIAAQLRTEGKRLVFTNGCFDLLHPGHTEYLALARAHGDALMVAVNSDASVTRQEKGPGRPIVPLADRMLVLAALESVDYVVPFDADTPAELIEEITPAVLAKGEDWRDRGVVGRDWVESHGGQVTLIPLREGNSTSAIVARILAAHGRS